MDVLRSLATSATLRRRLPGRFVEEGEAGHADEQAVGDLVEDGGVGAVGDVGGDFDAAVDRAGGEDEDVFFGAADAVGVHGEQVGVLGDAGEEGAALALELDAEEVHAVGVFDRFVEVVRDLDAELFDVRGDEGGGSADADFGAEFGQSPDVGAGDAAVQDVADEGDGEAGEGAAMFTDGEDVEQSPGWGARGYRRRR